MFGFSKVRYRGMAMSEYCLKVICALCCIYCRHDSQNAGDREPKARLFSDSAQEGGGLSVFISCVARQQRFSHPDEQAVIGFTERALLATCIPMMAWSAACGFPSLAEDYVDQPLDFNELLIEWPEGSDEPNKYWLSNLPPRTSLKRLVHVEGALAD